MTRNVLVIIVLIVSALAIYNEFSQKQQQTAKVKELEAKLQKLSATVVPQNGSLKDQMLCAGQAERVFEAFKGDTHRHPGGDSSETASFFSHYQPSSGRCFVEIDRSLNNSAGLFHNRYISDAIGGDLLGTYVMEDAVKPLTVQCRVTGPDRHTVDCESEDEFNALAGQYMK
jgi:hypothetical protein